MFVIGCKYLIIQINPRFLNCNVIVTDRLFLISTTLMYAYANELSTERHYILTNHKHPLDVCLNEGIPNVTLNG